MTEKRRRPPAQDIGRILGGGMSPEDFIKLMNATELNCETFDKVLPEDAEDFVAVCEQLGDAALAYAQRLERTGHVVTASQYYFNASALYRLGDYGIKGLSDEKYRVYDKLIESFKKHKQLDHSGGCEFVEIPFEGNSMPGYLLIPANASDDVPVVICVVGATGFKEENFVIASAIAERGCAALIFDGPGQGDALLNRKLYLTADNYDRAVKAVIDFIHKDPRLGDNIGLSGVSYGGYLATSAAAANIKEVSALVCRGGVSQTDQLTQHSFAGIDRFYMYNFLPKFNLEDLDKASEISHMMNVEPHLAQITCPVLVVHSAEDAVAGTEGAHTIYNKVSSSDKEYYEVPGNVHCGNNEALKTNSYCADWIVDRLTT